MTILSNVTRTSACLANKSKESVLLVLRRETLVASYSAELAKHAGMFGEQKPASAVSSAYKTARGPNRPIGAEMALGLPIAAYIRI